MRCAYSCESYHGTRHAVFGLVKRLLGNKSRPTFVACVKKNMSVGNHESMHGVAENQPVSPRLAVRLSR